MDNTERNQILSQIRCELKTTFSEVENIGNRFYVNGPGPIELEKLVNQVKNEFRIPIEIVILGYPTIFIGSAEHSRKLMKNLSDSGSFGICAEAKHTRKLIKSLRGRLEPKIGNDSLGHEQTDITLTKDEIEKILS